MPAPTPLDRLLPYGIPVPRSWLIEQGLSRHQLDNALKSGKLTALARGVVARTGLSVSWQGLAASLSKTSGTVYVGGISALAQEGVGQYVNMGSTVHLYSKFPQPEWSKKIEVDAKIVWHTYGRIWNEDVFLIGNSLKKKDTVYQWPFWVAHPEQAYLELLAEVPDSISFEYADEIMQGLTFLSPKRLDVLLRGCESVKVKRLFVLFAKRNRYAWFDRLQLDLYDFGAGKRMLVREGRLHKELGITVPEEFYG